MRVDIEGFHVIAVDEAVVFVRSIVAAVVFKALPVEVFPEGCIR